jgi:hypothetical protein
VSIESPWFTVKTAIPYSHRSGGLITRALREGTLRGSQTKANGTWLIHRDDLDAWLRGEVAEVRTPVAATRRHTA